VTLRGGGRFLDRHLRGELRRAYFRAPQKVGRSGDATLFHLAIDDLADPDLLRAHAALTVVTATARLVGDVTVE
jgi:hypothetical protein